MPDLIPVTMRSVGTETVQTVNARDLHAFLHVKARFNDWITRRIETYGFVQGIDFIHYSDLSNDLPVPSVEYYLSLNMAKELSMVERTAKGKEARLYFLACEKAAQESHAIPQVKNPAHQILIDTVVRLDAVEQRAIAAEQRAIEADKRAIEAEASANRANTKSDLALEDAHRMTLEQFILKNGLVRQFPQTQYRTYVKWLKDFCAAYGLKIMPEPVYGKSWDHELAYPLAALGAWLNYETKRPKQEYLKPVARKEP